MTGGSLGTGSLANATSTFNVADESGVLRLLQTLHQSPLPVETKNKLRDVVFAYRSHPKETDTAALQALFQEFEVSVIFEPANAVDTDTQTVAPAAHTEAVVPFGRQRLTPQFQAPTGSKKSTPTSTNRSAASSSNTTSAAAAEAVPTNEIKTTSTPPVATTVENANTGTTTNTTFAPATAAQDSAVNKVPIKKIPAEPTATDATNTTVEALDTEQPTGDDSSKNTPPVEATTTTKTAPTNVTTPSVEAATLKQQPVNEDTPETTASVEEVATNADQTTNDTNNDTNLAAPVPSASQTSSVQSPAARIKDIKHEINLKIGNPISLIDIDDAIGREYMAALLDAMKQTSVEETSAASERAMSRLEKAFQAVEALLAKDNPAPAEASSDESTSEPESRPEPEPTQTAVVPTPAAPVASEPTSETSTADAALAAVSTPDSEPVSSAPVTNQPVSNVNPATSEDTSSPTTEATDNEEDTPEVLASPPPRTTQATADSATPADDSETTVSSVATEEPTKAAIPAATTAENPASSTREDNTISSPAREKKIGTMLAEQEAARQAEKPQETGDPLYQEKVTHGLEQLLSEWSIFKRSGMFGTGPNGIEHPLYETLSNLTMSSVLTGRFDGVTPEVKRSINDYMNGWRYEEGIVHESSETFERYLRRVVQHILEKRSQTADQ